MADENYTLKLTGSKIDQAEAWAYLHRNSNPTQTEADLVVEAERAKTAEKAETARAQAAETAETERAQAAEQSTIKKIGNLDDLITDNKTDLVAAINEAAAGGGGGGGGGATTAAKVSFNNTDTGISSSNVQGALVEVDANVQELIAQVFPLTASYASSNAGTYEIGTAVTPAATLSITRKGADVKESATVTTSPECSIKSDNSGWSYNEITSGSLSIVTAIAQGGQTVTLAALKWAFTNYRYRGEVADVPTDYAAAIKALPTKELTTSTSLGSTTLSAGKYYLFAVEGTQASGDPLALVVKHAQTGGTISGCVLGVATIAQENDGTVTNDYTYVLVPASTDAWNFTISL